MKKLGFLKGALLGAMALAAGSLYANPGWPANYEGVMLQGFYWDSYNETSWNKLTNQADELSQSFKLIWIPNSAQSSGSPTMGYMPIYWFSHYNSSFGTEAQLKKMISTFKEKGTGMIADVVINHRVGVTNWMDFPAETWNGVTYKLTGSDVCRNDEVNNPGNPGGASGNYDEGDNFDGARDLDHTSANVQKNCKAYTKFLIDELGYAGFRYDMVKGYAGYYTGMYNKYSQPTYSVGEYWDSDYDKVAKWIDNTDKTSAAFDFPFKYAVNEAFSNNDFSKLSWKANGTTDQPAGMIHFAYSQYAVTFIDNHDTYRDGSRFSDSRVEAANAFMLASPGTPCVFWAHWTGHKTALKKMIAARNAAGVTNTSSVTVLRADRDCYMAVIKGTKGELAVKIGSAQVSPAGFNDSQIVCSGNDYCMWLKGTAIGGGGGEEIEDPNPETAFTVYFDNSASNWAKPYIHHWGGVETTWPGSPMTLHQGNLWKYTVTKGTTGLLFNAGDGDNTKTSDFEAKADHVYSISGDLGHIDSYLQVTYPKEMYLVGNLAQGNWNTAKGVAPTTAKDGVYTWNDVEVLDSGDGFGYFTFITLCGADWDETNSSDRFGATSKDAPLAVDGSAPVAKYSANVNASAAQSWKVAAGTYMITLDLVNSKVLLNVGAGVAFSFDLNDGQPVYFNLQGQPVANPGSGIYIRVLNGKAEKVMVK